MNQRQTIVQSVDPQTPDLSVLEQAGDLIRRGGLVAFPTETVYGLGANALDPLAVAAVFHAKGRPAANPVIVHVSSVDSAREFTTGWPDPAQELASSFWPGPLTLVLPRSPVVPDVVTAGGPTVAIRMPSHPVALGLVRAAKAPVAAPSANRSGEISPTTAAHVLRALAGKIDLILDGGATTLGLESTVIDLTSATPRILRPGRISKREIEAIIGDVDESASATKGPLRSPGLLPRHYAPRTPCEMASEAECANRVRTYLAAGQKIGLLGCGNAPSFSSGVVTLQLPCNAIEYAAGLYAALHQLDNAGVDRIVIVEPPTGEEWTAIHDRLRRATAG